MSDGLVSKLINSGAIATSAGSLGVIVLGAAAFILSGGNDRISWAGIYTGAGVGAVAGLVLSYLAYRDY